MERKPFSPDELNIAGEYPSAFPGMPGTPYYTTPVTPRENYAALMLRREKPYWIPMSGDYVFLAPRVNPDNIARGFVFDGGVPLTVEEKGGKDMFGIEWVFVPTVGGSMVKPGAPAFTDANEWEQKVVWPNIDEWDWAGAAETNKALVNDGRAVQAWFLNGIYERLISFMDFENAVVALIDEDQQDAVHAFFTKLCDLYEKIFDKYIEYFHMDYIFFHDDWGSQRAPFFSASVCREMIAPYLKRLVDYCHSKNVNFELHSCGSNELLIPVMIECGVDAWSPMANINDIPAYYAKYGDKITFGVAPAPLSKEATPEEIEKNLDDFFATYASKENAYVLGSFMDPRYKAGMYERSRKLYSK